MTDLNILCMKWGIAYGPEYVNTLYSMVRRHLHRDFRFVCFTDDANGLRKEIEVFPLPTIPVPPPHDVSPWRKLSMFQPNLANLKGLGLFLDLDIVIVDSIDDFVSYGQFEDFCIIENWTQLGQGIGNSSVYRFPIGQYAFIYEAYIQDPATVCKNYKNEQIFLSRQIVAHQRPFKFCPSTWCRSFKHHCVPKIKSWFKSPAIPAGAKIIAFPGYPNPPEAATGQWPGKFWRKVRPAPWIIENWR